MEDKQKEEVRLLVEKAAKAEKSDDAMRFSQAACNAANALITLENLERD
jgi:hypothetical protein